MDACLNKSVLWNSIRVFKLTINMRVQKLIGQDKEKASDFCEFLLRVGEGREPTFIDDNNECNNILIPESMLLDESENNLIKTVYPDIALR